MGKIFCIMGKSSTGKDTLYHRILNRKELGLQQIVSYTTRPIRTGETDGKEYHFCDHKEKERLLRSGKVVEIRSYDTCHGIWDYFTVDDGNIDLAKENYIVIGTIESFIKLREYFSRDAVIPIYIEVEDGIRLQRALDREKVQQQPKYEEMCRRFLADASDFSKEKLENAEIRKVFYNEDLEETEQEILHYVKEEMEK